MPPRRCQHCRQLVPAGSRCGCRPTTRTRYDSAERARRRQTVTDHLEAYGPVCPGWHRDMHLVEAAALAADHVHPVAAGGDPGGPLQVLCRQCNGAKGARLD